MSVDRLARLMYAGAVGFLSAQAYSFWVAVAMSLAITTVIVVIAEVFGNDV